VRGAGIGDRKSATRGVADGGEDCWSACMAGGGRSPARRRPRTRSANAVRQATQLATRLPVTYVPMIKLRKNTTTISRNMNTSSRVYLRPHAERLRTACAVQWAPRNDGPEFGPFFERGSRLVRCEQAGLTTTSAFLVSGRGRRHRFRSRSRRPSRAATVHRGRGSGEPAPE